MDGMVRVIKGNKETLIPVYKKGAYLQQGYNVIDEKGTIIEQGAKANHVLKEELDKANARIKELEEALKQSRSKAKKPEENA